jgi:hypothetical protein
LAAALVAALVFWTSTLGADARSPGEAGAWGENAPEESLPLGRNCTVRVETAGGADEVSGELRHAGSQWLVLRVEVEARSEQASPILAKIPHTSRLFKNVGIGRVREDYWIPRERIVYIRIGERPTATAGNESEAAPPQPPIE